MLWLCVCATAFIPTGVQLEEFKTRHLSFVISSTLLYGDEDMFTFLFFIYLFRLLFCPSLDVSETKNEVVVHYYFVTQNERNIINNIIPKNSKQKLSYRRSSSPFFFGFGILTGPISFSGSRHFSP
jgi:hypothetical protein